MRRHALWRLAEPLCSSRSSLLPTISTRSISTIQVRTTPCRNPQQTARRLPSRRPFSATPLARVKAAGGSGRQMQYSPKRSAQRTPALQRKEALARAANDPTIYSNTDMMELGVLPSTFVSCRWSEQPPILSGLADRWMWDKSRLRHLLVHSFTTLMLKYHLIDPLSAKDRAALPWWRRLRHRLTSRYDMQRKLAPRIATDLYVRMHEALAAGRPAVEALRGSLKPGLYASLEERVSARGRYSVASWELLRWNVTPTLRSWSVNVMEQSEDGKRQSFVQQAVVEMDSVQRLSKGRRVVAGQKIDEGGQPVDEDGVQWYARPTSRVREFMVIQKSTVKGVSGPWMAWGMTNRTTMEDVKKAHNEKLGIEA